MKSILTVIGLLWVIGISAQYQHDSLKTDKGYLHYFTKGSGNPVLLLQGGPGFSHYYMRAIADSLGNNKTILIDYQGTGYSNYRNIDSTWVSNDQIIADIEMVRKHLEINKWTLIGHSYGGMFALLYATKHPDNTEKIITISNVGTNQEFQNHYTDNILSRISPENRRRLAEIQSGKIKPNNEIPGWNEAEVLFLQGYFYNPENIQKLINTIPPDALKKFNNADFHGAYWNNKANRDIDITNEVLALNIPIRMIEAWQDPNYDGRQLLLNALLKDSKIKFINQSGHFQWIEQPTVFFNILNGFLNDNEYD